MLRWDEQLPPRVDNQVLRWNPEVQNILHLGNDVKDKQPKFFLQKRWLVHHQIDSEWIGSSCLICECAECLYNNWVYEEMWTSDISTLVKKLHLFCQIGSTPTCCDVSPYFVAIKTKHIISHDEPIYHQIKNKQHMFFLTPCDTSLLQHLLLQSLSPCRSVERPKVVQVSQKVNRTCDEFGDGQGGRCPRRLIWSEWTTYILKAIRMAIYRNFALYIFYIHISYILFYFSKGLASSSNDPGACFPSSNIQS